MRTSTAALLATLFLTGNSLAQVAEKEPAAILEIGGAGEWALTHGKPSYGPPLYTHQQFHRYNLPARLHGSYEGRLLSA
jgi:hypothetical protein